MRLLKQIIRETNIRINQKTKRLMCTLNREEDKKEESETEAKEFVEFLNSLTNYEKSGVPKGGGTDSDDGLDLGRMRRLMASLGDPHSSFKAVHIAGTKGKGSTAAFLSNILRAQGYSVGCYTSPHIMTIRERMTVGKLGEPVSAKTLNGLFCNIKHQLDEAIQHENGCLTHFEVLTATAFSLFAQENVDIAVIETGMGGARDATNVISSSGLVASVITTIGEEHLDALGGSLESIAMAKAGVIKNGRPVILGGPFLPHIELIFREQASLKQAPVILVSDPGIRTTIKGIGVRDSIPRQLCDLKIHVNGDFQLLMELSNVELRMLGNHQLQNASTAACAALCLRNQGWNISDESVRTALETTCLPGRSQFLSYEEAKSLGLSGVKVLVDGAHTKDSAKALVDTIRMISPKARLALIVAMASDKDHVGFAKEFLSGSELEAVFLTESDIAGGRSRTTSASLLRDHWIEACEAMGISSLHDLMSKWQTLNKQISEDRVLLIAERSLDMALKAVNEILRARASAGTDYIVVVTGSLHIVSSVLASLRR